MSIYNNKQELDDFWKRLTTPMEQEKADYSLDSVSFVQCEVVDLRWLFLDANPDGEDFWDNPIV